MSEFPTVVISKTVDIDSRKISLNQNSKAKRENISFVSVWIHETTLQLKRVQVLLKNIC